MHRLLLLCAIAGAILATNAPAFSAGARVEEQIVGPQVSVSNFLLASPHGVRN